VADPHSGLRAYKLAALSRIPFHFNSAGIEFDTEVTIQLGLAGQRILDVPVPDFEYDDTTGIDWFPLDEGNTLDAFHLHDLNRSPLPVDLSEFDHAVMLDVLEHLQSPESFVDAFRASAERNPGLTLIISTPNVAFGIIRLMLLFGQFNYGKRGILDLTHTRLFTFGTFRRLFDQSGYDVLKMIGVPAPFPLALGDRPFARWLLRIHELLIRISRRFFAFQIFAVVRPKPGLGYLIDHAASHGQITKAKAPRDIR
jgi:hypothetical protein